MAACSHCGLEHSTDGPICPVTEEPMREPGPCGTRIDRYEVERFLGGGGFGAVYRARHVVMDRPVALKLLHTRLSAPQRALERFFQEAKAAAAIGHPSIVQVHDAGVAPDGTAFLAMELVDGCSLHDLAEVDRLPMRRAIDIALQVLDALEAAHQCGIVHRDVKPGNIMLAGTDPDGSRSQDRVKLVDFGISKVRKMGADAELTRSNMSMGSPGYAAPEQYVSARDVDARADVYGVGVVMYRSLTGELPFDADSYEQMVVRVCTSEPTPLASRRPDLPAMLAAVIDRAIARDRDARHPSARAFAEGLRATLEHVSGERKLPSEAPEAFAPTVATDGTGRYQAMQHVPPTVDRSSDVRPSAPRVETPPTRPSHVTPEPRTRRSGILFAAAAVALVAIGVTAAVMLSSSNDAEVAAPVAVTAPPPADPGTATETEAPTEPETAAPEPETAAESEAAASAEDTATVTDPDPETITEAAPPSRAARRRRPRRAPSMAAPAETVPADPAPTMRATFGTEDLEPF